VPRRPLLVLSAAVLAALLAACTPGDSTSLEPADDAATPTGAPSAVLADGADDPALQAPAASIVSPAPRTTAPAPPPADSRPDPGGGSDSSCDPGAGAGEDQVVVVRGSGTRATVRACSRQADGTYSTDLGPYRGYVGRSGVTSAASKREGDGHTPGGVYALRGGFGAKGDPGLAQGWFVVDGNDFWVDDPSSSLYNTHQRGPADGRWGSAENLLTVPAYNYAQVIGYNESSTPGKGSAIFLHVSTGGPTAGCVSLPTDALLAVLRWQDPGAVIAIS
jgi:L,D-peptidoglycan transpeptidase YkuD (ErfK/YbiS/YcfS/YnhG family)